jgi:hypothetical protein
MARLSKKNRGTATQARQTRSKSRSKRVKRAATIKQLSKTGGRKRAKQKMRTSGAVGNDWR